MMIYDREIVLFCLPETFFALRHLNPNIYLTVTFETITRFKIISKHRSYILHLFDLTLCAKDIHIHNNTICFGVFLCSVGKFTNFNSSYSLLGM